MATRLTADNLAPTLVTAIVQGGGPKISNIFVANATYDLIDDTAISLDGGYIIINGTGFESNINVLVDETPVVSATRISDTEIRAQLPALSSGSKIVYLVNTDNGGTAIRVNGVSYSGTPTWVTGSTLPEGITDQLISIQLSANSDSNVSYQVQSDSTLPAGLTLAANGLLSGTITGITDETLYNFTVEATDEENQESSRSFSITIDVNDEYFYATTLLLTGDGTNGAQNNTFSDSSNNNLTPSVTGTIIQGSFSPFSSPDGRWSSYFDGTGDYLQVADDNSLDLSGDFTIELWFYWVKRTGATFPRLMAKGDYQAAASAWRIDLVESSGYCGFAYGSTDVSTSFGTQTPDQWTHLAVTRSGSTLRTFRNGVLQNTRNDVTQDFTSTYVLRIGAANALNVNELFCGNISNVRIIKGTALYTSNFTPSTSPLTAITNTSLLTCQSNRFKDNSTNNFTITGNGNVKVTPFSPFRPTNIYSTATKGGTAYFDGGTGRLSYSASSLFNLGTTYTAEFWIYLISYPSEFLRILMMDENTSTSGWVFGIGTTGGLDVGSPSPLGGIVNSGANTIGLNQWHHVAVSRNGSVARLYVNGVKVGENGSPATQAGGSPTFKVGYDTVGTVAGRFTGWISDIRIIKNEALYTGETYTVPTEPLTSNSNTSILLNFSNAGIIDYTGKNNLRTVGNSQISTSVKKYGTGSMYFDGNGDYCVSVPSTEIPFLTGDFTIECWVYPINGGKGSSFSRIINIGATNVAGSLGINTYSTENPTRLEAIIWSGTNTPSIVLGSQDTIPNSTWTHIAFTRSGTTCRFFINGVQKDTSTSSVSITSNILYVGSKANSEYFNGYIDDLRITKGVARYTSNFTPPNKAHLLR